MFAFEANLTFLIKLHRYLCERDRKAFQALFKLLDQEANISYNDFNTLSSKIMRNGVHLPEVRSTFRHFLEGDTLRSAKKRIRALVDDSKDDHGQEKKSRRKGKNRAKDAGAAHREKQDNDVDSVEGAGECGTCFINLLLAQGNIQQCPEGHVQCADCFQRLGGDHAPCPVCTQKLGNIRNRYVENLRDAHQARQLTTQDRKAAKEGGGLEAADLSVDTSRKSVVQKIARPSVLLLDEVDIFFGEGFYGKPYRPCMTVDSEDGSELLRSIWISRHTLPKSEASVQSLMARPEVAKLRASFPNFSADILKREV